MASLSPSHPRRHVHTYTQTHTQYTHTGSRQTAHHPHQQTLPLSPISYLLLSTRPGIQAVFTDLQTASEMIDKHGQVMEVPLRHFSREVQKKKKRLAHSTGTGTPQEQTILTEDFGSFQGLSVTFSRPLKKMVFEASQWRQLIVQGFFKDSKLYRVEWLRIQLNNRLHTDVEGTLCTSASVIKS